MRNSFHLMDLARTESCDLQSRSALFPVLVCFRCGIVGIYPTFLRPAFKSAPSKFQKPANDRTKYINMIDQRNKLSYTIHFTTHCPQFLAPFPAQFPPACGKSRRPVVCAHDFSWRTSFVSIRSFAAVQIKFLYSSIPASVRDGIPLWNYSVFVPCGPSL